MKNKSGKKLQTVLLTLVMVIGLLPVASMTAYAAEQSVTLKSGTTSSGPIISTGFLDRKSRRLMGRGERHHCYQERR